MSEQKKPAAYWIRATYCAMGIAVAALLYYDVVKSQQAPTVVPPPSEHEWRSLRAGIKADERTLATAILMQRQHWRYVMPRPKGPQAAWGNTDKRTTWWIGYWHQTATNRCSSKTPELEDQAYHGDGLGRGRWRRGGSPRAPSKLQWLLSEKGGVKPRD